MKRADHKFYDATLLLLKMLIGFSIAGLAGSPASRKPAWKVVLLSSHLWTHLACSTGYPLFCDAMTLLSLPSYHCYPTGYQQLKELSIRCPLPVGNSFASCLLVLLATHVVANQLGPGM